jgi:SPP1 gp7 family putative phage head morphogenesis protein
MDNPVSEYTKNIRNTLQASVDFNHTLVTGIQNDIHEKIFSAVMLSLTSPNPEEQGASGIFNAIMKTKQFSKDRAELIARDQNSKVYASLNTERMRQAGVEKFRWIHSSAGKVPRQTHLDKDGEIFDIDDPRLWEGPKADRGPPGWAINCRCRAAPVIG